MKSAAASTSVSFSNYQNTDVDARRLARQQLICILAIYLHFGTTLLGWLPYWTLLLSLPVLVVRWMLAVHELFHLRDATQVDPFTRYLPLLLTPFSLGYREFRNIHGRHHRYMATPEDPEYYQIRGNKLSGFLNACMGPEQAYFRWLAARGVDSSLLHGTLMRLFAFGLLIWVSGWAFLWYWLPVRLAHGSSYFSFFYMLHRRGEDYGVYPVKLSSVINFLLGIVFGREALMATCHHDAHHLYPKVNAEKLAQIRSTPEFGHKLEARLAQLGLRALS